MAVGPDNQSQAGDCFRTCVAMLLGFDDPTQVPNFVKANDDTGETMTRRANRWLARRGLCLMNVPIYVHGRYLSQVVSEISQFNQNQPYMLWAYQSPRHVAIDESHSVIVVGPDVWCDPAYPERKHIDPDEYLPDRNGFVWFAVLAHKTGRVR